MSYCSSPPPLPLARSTKPKGINEKQQMFVKSFCNQKHGRKMMAWPSLSAMPCNVVRICVPLMASCNHRESDTFLIYQKLQLLYCLSVPAEMTWSRNAREEEEPRLLDDLSCPHFLLHINFTHLLPFAYDTVSQHTEQIQCCNRKCYLLISTKHL